MKDILNEHCVQCDGDQRSLMVVYTTLHAFLKSKLRPAKIRRLHCLNDDSTQAPAHQNLQHEAAIPPISPQNPTISLSLQDTASVQLSTGSFQQQTTSPVRPSMYVNRITNLMDLNLQPDMQGLCNVNLNTILPGKISSIFSTRTRQYYTKVS